MRGWIAGAALAFLLVAAGTARATHASAIVRLVDVGSGANEAWIFAPEEPPVCELVFLHDEGELSPDRYTAWLSHVAVGDHCVVVFPRYEKAAGASPAADLRAIRTTFAEAQSFLESSSFGAQREHAATRLPLVAGGFGTGATLALTIAAESARLHLPRAVALDAVFPVATRSIALPATRLRASVRVLAEFGDRDRVAGSASAHRVRRYLATHPASHRQIMVVHSNGGLAAVHGAPLGQSAGAQLSFWQPLDILLTDVS